MLNTTQITNPACVTRTERLTVDEKELRGHCIKGHKTKLELQDDKSYHECVTPASQALMCQKEGALEKPDIRAHAKQWANKDVSCTYSGLPSSSYPIRRGLQACTVSNILSNWLASRRVESMLVCRLSKGWSCLSTLGRGISNEEEMFFPIVSARARTYCAVPPLSFSIASPETCDTSRASAKVAK